MVALSQALTGFLLLAEHVLAAKRVPATTFKDCQRKTDAPLEGCPEGTLYVSQDDATASFTTIQAAIRSLPNDTSSHVILVGAGIYTEQLNVTRSGPVTLLGQSDRPWKGELYADVTYDEDPQNDVQVFFNAANHESRYPDNLYTSVLAVGPTYNATQTGAGPTGYPVPEDTPFGCSDFRAYNIDFRNEFAPRAMGPAHAIAVGYANAGFYSCGFYSYQDTVSTVLQATLGEYSMQTCKRNVDVRAHAADKSSSQIYIGKLGNAVMHDSVVAGQVDFLYGFGTLFLDWSTLLWRSCGGGLTAWKGTNTTFENKYGVYIANTNVLATNSSIREEKRGACSLGRPWNSIHRSLFMNSYLDETTLPQGYTTWGGGNFDALTTMAVYDVYGPGNNETAQRQGGVTLVWNRKQARPYLRPINVFREPKSETPSVDWIDEVVPVSC